MSRSRLCALLPSSLALTVSLGCSAPPTDPQLTGSEVLPANPEQPPASPESDSASEPLPNFVRDVIEKRDNELRACYEAAARVDPSLAGTVTLRIEIGADGKVDEVEALDGDAFGAPRAVACMLRGVRRWRFDVPKGSGPVEVRHPFEFSWD